MTSLPLTSITFSGLATRKASVCEEIMSGNGPKRPNPTIIAIAGGTASGKTTLSRKIIEMIDFDKNRVAIISQDSFYKVLSAEERELAKKGEYNFDSPDAFDKKLFIDTLDRLRRGKQVDIPTYDFKTSSRTDESTRVNLVECILVEGILVLSPEYCHLYDMKIFVDTDSDIRLARRIKRDTVERGRTMDSILSQYLTHVKPSYDQFVKPCKRNADLVIPWGAENTVAVELIVRSIKHVLQACSNYSKKSGTKSSSRTSSRNSLSAYSSDTEDSLF
ncbi:hypothetical protein GEMRC1_009058 [Eukaryota sp. GEM-RC1]